MTRLVNISIQLLIAVVLAGAYFAFPVAPTWAQDTPTAPADTFSLLRDGQRVQSGQKFFKGAQFVGAETCKSCHEKQYGEWRATWHAKMERLPSKDVVVGDFNDRVVTYKNVKVKGKDGKTVKLTFSVKAFQKGGKYLFTVLDKDNPKNNQTFEIAKVLGGKWDQHYEIKVGDNYLPTPLRWSVENGDWLASSYNPKYWVKDDGTPDGRPRKIDELPKYRFAEAKCAGCHTTGYDFVKDKASGVWKAKGKGELGIACEKCHGPASLHVKEANASKAAGKVLKAGTSTIVHPLKDLNPLQQTQVCAQCHGRNTNKKIKEIAFPLGFLPGDTDMTSRSMFWSYSGVHKKSQHKYFYPNDWAKRNRQQWQDFTKSTHFNTAGMSCLTCHTFHGKWENAQLRMKPEKLCISCHSENGYARRPNAEMYAGSPMEKAGVTCVDCHMAKIGYRSNKTAKKPHPWDVSSHTFMVATPALQKSSGVRSACMACHQEGKKALPHLKKGIEVPVFSLDELQALRADKRATIRSLVNEIRAVLRSIKSDRAYVKARVDRANSMVNFVLLDRSMGLHNSEKAETMLQEALKLANRAVKMK
ncbi:MAG: ammonia-forming cytochrome c nitrite reductase subunit c552 [Proteobacteria bacterium]|nr:ammonia-forming cytochrome c nitrite reductase subunit c552 [Pseudomonadota bacterium]